MQKNKQGKPFFANFLEDQITSKESSTVKGGEKIITRIGTDTAEEWGLCYPSYTFHVSVGPIFPEIKRNYNGSRRYFPGDTNDISCRFFPD